MTDESPPAGEAPTRGQARGLWPLTAGEVAALTGGRLSGAAGAAAGRVVTDSRGGVRPGDLFVGLAGPHFDGGAFAADALAAGATIALVTERAARSLASATAHLEEQALVEVDDPLAALQALAAEARRRFGGTVVAITGSNGKTMVKDMLLAALSSERRVSASPRSFNSQIGVALSLLQVDPAAEVAILECGMSQPGEIARLQPLVRPDHGILTNIGDAHIAPFGSRSAIAHEKAQLFTGLAGSGWVLTPASEVLGRGALGAVGARVMTVGGALASEGSGDFAYEPAADGQPALLARDGETVRLALTPDLPHVLVDAALAAAAALLLGATPAAIERGLADWRPAPMRLEMSTTPRGILLINDAYTADPVSVEAALLALVREATAGARTVAVLGGMAQLGELRRAAHGQVGRRVAELGIDRLVGVGEGGAEIADAARDAGMASDRIHTVADVSEAALVLEEHCRSGDRVLLKASRPERLERIASLLFHSVSPARLYVDLDRLRANYRAIRQAVGPAVGVMAVVKSFGYGLDAVRVSRTLERIGLEYLAVAYPDEGVRLRDAGVATPILVQNILAHEVDKVVRYRLTAQVATAEQIAWLSAEAQRQGAEVVVHLKIDTGMGRAGARPDQALALAQAIAADGRLELEGLMTHLAAADEPAHDDYSRHQLELFEQVRRELAAAGLRPRWVHAANSAAIERFPESRHTMVRAGLALFGYGGPEVIRRGGARPSGDDPPPPGPVLRLVTQVVSVRTAAPGQAVGYGLTFEIPPGGERRVAVVAIGYNDGYPWSLSNRGWMAVQGQRCPVIGRVCMDVTLLDVTAAPAEVRPGDEVVVFGPDPDEPSLLEAAELAGTIPYELLTRLSPRVRRIFRGSH